MGRSGTPAALVFASTRSASFLLPRCAMAVPQARCASPERGSMLRTFPTDHSQSALSKCTWIDLARSERRRAGAGGKGLRRAGADARRARRDRSSPLSRLQVEDGTLYMTAPLILAQGTEPWTPTPAGFVLTEHVLLTVRYAPSLFFDTVVKEISGHDSFEPALALVRILEELVDHTADLLEGSGNDLDDASHVIFRPGKRAKLSHETSMLRQLMIRTGRTSERMARIHYTLVCLDRMAKFTQERGRDWIEHNLCADLQPCRPTSARWCSSPKAWSAACSFCRTPRPASSISTRTT